MKKTCKVYIIIHVCKKHVKSYSKTKIFRGTDAKLRNFAPKNGNITNCTAFHRMGDIFVEEGRIIGVGQSELVKISVVQLGFERDKIP